MASPRNGSAMIPTRVMTNRNERTAEPRITASPIRNEGIGRSPRIVPAAAKAFGNISPSSKRTISTMIANVQENTENGDMGRN